jgi:hypothetical protein
MSRYAEQRRDPRWQRKRLEVMSRDDFRCVDCRNERRTLNVHHLRYRDGAAPWEYELHELVTLCELCHVARHAASGRQPAISRRGPVRGSLVRQAIARLVLYPAIAAEVSSDERAGLDASEEAGVALLRELLDNLREQPAQISAQVIQRWAGREGAESLQKLLEREEVISDAPAAAGELRSALVKLADLAVERRLVHLEAQSRCAPLSSDEILEFRALMARLSARRGQ